MAVKITQKINQSNEEKEYKIFTSEFDEIARAENLENTEEISKHHNIYISIIFLVKYHVI